MLDRVNISRLESVAHVKCTRICAIGHYRAVATNEFTAANRIGATIAGQVGLMIHRTPNRNELPNATRLAYCVTCGKLQSRVNLPGRCDRTGCNGILSRRHYRSINRHNRVMVTSTGQESKRVQRNGELQSEVTRHRADLAVQVGAVPCVTRLQIADNIGLVR